MLLALITLALLVAYHALRLLASSCEGSGCDVLIPFSLLLPLLIVIMVAITGVQATLNSGRFGPARRTVLGGLTAVGVLGPILALLVFRDRPDAFVWTATVLIILLPLAVIAFWLRDRGLRSRRLPD